MLFQLRKSKLYKLHGIVPLPSGRSGYASLFRHHRPLPRIITLPGSTLEGLGDGPSRRNSYE